MNKKNIAFIIISLLIIIGVIIAIEIAIDFNKEAKIRNEVKEIINIMTNDIENTEKANEILTRRIITKGKYKTVEDNLKKYYTDLYNNYSNLLFLENDDNFSNYLSITNLKEDRPDFIKSKNNLQNSKAQIDEYYNSFVSLLTKDENKEVYIMNKKITSYYKDFYFTLTNELNTKEFLDNIKENYEIAKSKITIYNKAFDYLIVNKGNWELKNNSLIFKTIENNEEYLKIIAKLNPKTEE